MPRHASPLITTLPHHTMPFTKGISDPAALAAANRPSLSPSARQSALNALPRPGALQWVDPQAGILNSSISPISPPPALNSPELAADLFEVAAIGLLADVPLDQWANHPIALKAAKTLGGFPYGILSADLCRLHGTDGLARLNATRRPADRVGSLLREPIPIAWGAPSSFAARRREGWYLTSEQSWRAAQQGGIPGQHPNLPAQRFGPISQITTGRDLASLVQSDPPGSISLAVAQQLQAARARRSSRFPAGTNDVGFVGRLQAVEINNCIGSVLMQAFRLGWRQKWIDYNFERPEELWPLAAAGSFHPLLLQLGGWIFDEIHQRHGDRRFLPQIYAGGCPCHPDWPSGHAIEAGVGATILKATFADGPLTLPSGVRIASAHEAIDTAMWNLALGRSIAGIHTMGSLRQGMLLGQSVAIDYLNNQWRDPYVTAPVSFLDVTGWMITVGA